MRKIIAKREDVLKQIRENYNKHIAAYKEAFEGYKIELEEQVSVRKKMVTEALDNLVDRAKAADLEKGQKPVRADLSTALVSFPSLKPPESHAGEYEVVIKMLEMHTEDTIELDTSEVESYCLDRWLWIDDFAVGSAPFIEKYQKTIVKTPAR